MKSRISPRPDETHTIVDSINNDIIDLQIVDGFLAAVEKKFLQVNQVSFDVRGIKDSLIELQKLGLQGSRQEFLISELALNDQLRSWTKSLIERDSKIETQQVRRFCDEFKQPIDYRVFSALTRFYRGAPHSPSIQSKYDFAVTRLFLKEGKHSLRELRIERDEIVRHLVERFYEWDIHNSQAADVSSEAVSAVNRFDDFIFEAEFVTTFEELVATQLFDKLRSFKLELGELIYNPSVTASAIECNIVVGNVFAELLAQENEKLSRIVSDEFDFASALHDTSPGAPSHTSLILENIRHEDIVDVHNLDNDSSQIWQWLQTVCANATNNEPTARVEEPPPGNTFVGLAAKQRYSHLLSVISDSNSDKTPLVEYLQKHPTLRSVDIGMFLSPDNPEGLKRLYQATMSAVLWSEELRTVELIKHESLADECSSEISLALEELQDLSEKLRSKAEDFGDDVPYSLMYVSNQLLETRLKMERAIVRYSKQKLDATKAVNEPVVFVSTREAASPIFNTGFEANRWLVYATVFFVVVSFAIYFTVNTLDNSVKVMSDIEMVQVKSLPGSENLEVAQRVKDSLYVTVNSRWKTLEEGEKGRLMGEMLAVPMRTPIVSISILDKDGNLLANATADQVNIVADVSEP